MADEQSMLSAFADTPVTKTGTGEEHQPIEDLGDGGSDYQVPEKFLTDSGEPDIGKIVNSYRNLEQQFRNRDVPKAPEEYTYERQENSIWDDDSLAALSSMAKDAGLSLEQHNKIAAALEPLVTEYRSANSPEAHEAKLREEFGSSYESNIKNAVRAVKTLAPDTDLNSPIFNNADVIRLLAAAGAKMSEDTVRKGASTGHGDVWSEGYAKELDELLNNPLYGEDPSLERRVDKLLEMKLKQR